MSPLTVKRHDMTLRQAAGIFLCSARQNKAACALLHAARACAALLRARGMAPELPKGVCAARARGEGRMRMGVS